MNHASARTHTDRPNERFHAARPNVLPFPSEPTHADLPRSTPEPASAEMIAALESRLGAAIARTGLAVEDLALSLDERHTAPTADRPDRATAPAILVVIALALVALIPDPTARLVVAVAIAIAIVAERAVRAAQARLILGGSHAR